MGKYFDVAYIGDAFAALIPFLSVTIWVTILSVLIGTAFGFLIAAAKLSKYGLARKLANGYTTLIRCTPSIVLLFLIFYGVPALFEPFGINLNDWSTAVFVVITFSLQFAAAMSEVIRSSYQSIDKGQFEAAVSVGLSPLQAYWRIIVPQALVIALPNFGNSFLALIKEGALAYTIGLIDVIGKANLIIASNYNAHALEIYIALAIIYWILSFILERLFYLLEKWFSKGKQSLKTV
ncbi:amino acid ABC transporter permease [Paenibacillus albiflavus]|uniref:Amino acid ABC transporter permease n=1 Tax=Paenibacillus albiflavus TaxID=2545760 RepID=A0A4R4ELT3_9BACL|nr:amino acid ABC transporter permease [Paenibacillus albiflavus]TCZ79278.1 amino acid ABC transporter permease [Paenibacillus albiflavus]